MKVPRWISAFLLPNLLAGLTSGLVTLVYSISFAALIFSGRLTAYFPQGVGTALIGATITAIIVAWRSPFPFTLAGPEANSAILLTLAASGIAAALDLPEHESSIFPTVWAAIILSTTATGLFLYLLGRFRWGRLARYVPYPVIGGFLAGTGWLITRSSFKVMTGVPLNLVSLPTLFLPDIIPEWIAGLVMTAILFAVLSRAKHFLALPGLLVGAVALGNAAWYMAPPGLLRTAHDTWFFKPFSGNSVWQSYTSGTWAHIDWTVLFHQGFTLLALMAIVVLSILLNSTGLELATSRNVDLDQELRANGIANLVNGCCGGMVGYLSINRCLLNQQAGARSPLAGMIAGGLCGAVLLLGSSFLTYVPKPVLGGLLLYIGTNLLFRWVYQAWFRFPRMDYFLILLILVIVATLGFLQGVGAGILIACFLFILSYGRTSSIKYTLSGRNYQSNVHRSPPQQRLLEQEGDSVAILVLHGFVFFGTANDLLDKIRRRLATTGKPPLRYAVFDFRLVTGLDSSAALSFMKLRQLADKSDLKLVFTQLGEVIEPQLRQGGLFSGPGSTFHCFSDLDHGIEWCENQILKAADLLATPITPLEAQLRNLLDNAELVARFLSYLRSVHVPEGQHIFHQGEASDGLYFLESGRVTVVIELPGGKTLRRRTYTSGAILGEMGFFGRVPRSASVIADQASQLHFLSSDVFRQMETELPLLAAAFNRGVVNLVAERLRRSEEEVRILLQ